MTFELAIFVQSAAFGFGISMLFWSVTWGISKAVSIFKRGTDV